MSLKYEFKTYSDIFWLTSDVLKYIWVKFLGLKLCQALYHTFQQPKDSIRDLANQVAETNFQGNIKNSKM